MRIAVVSPLYEAVPPKAYGGTERIVSYLTEELVRKGHQVTLFASGDSQTRARLVSPCRRATRLDPMCQDPVALHVLMLEEVSRRASEFDVIHFNVDYLAFPWARRLATPSLSTLHGRLDIRELKPLFREFREHPVVSISNAQRRPLPFANWVGTVYHGLPPDLYRPSYEPGRHLAFVGRISPEKRPDRAIRIARRAGIPLLIAAKVDRADREYYEQKIRPLLREPGVEFVGELDDRGKQELLGGAAALLFPIDWPEPFGLLMIEAMACGTPVIAWPCGSVPEVLKDGVTGFVVSDEREAVRAVERIGSIDRRRCRAEFERRFTAERMARDYLHIYGRLAAARHPQVA
ncbi:MAG: glycosyltransferase family 4 protein [Acidobacteria bacterium]|nr:MAG: glycosyltransferase family 4 protein [Acidobacteriota bacterium]